MRAGNQSDCKFVAIGIDIVFKDIAINRAFKVCFDFVVCGIRSFVRLLSNFDADLSHIKTTVAIVNLVGEGVETAEPFVRRVFVRTVSEQIQCSVLNIGLKSDCKFVAIGISIVVEYIAAGWAVVVCLHLVIGGIRPCVWLRCNSDANFGDVGSAIAVVNLVFKRVDATEPGVRGVDERTVWIQDYRSRTGICDQADR